MHKKKAILTLLLLVLSRLSIAQQLQPTAKFSFDNRSATDQTSGLQPKLVGVNFCDDRFGNRNNAVHIFGNEFSYINLGNAPQLKPKIGSISLWVSIEREVYTGRGYTVNPIIITKNGRVNDFIESYGIYYDLNSKKVNASSARDSLRQSVVTGVKKFDLYTWHHLAVTYDNDFFCFYVDGKLQRKSEKQFETIFSPLDSVLIGVSANSKNNRFMEGAIDDITFYDKVLDQEQIEDLFEAPNPNNTANFMKWLFYAVLAALFLFAFYKLIQRQIRVREKKEKMLLEVRNIVLETDLKVNRALMNPHFVFNSLNTLQNFILKNENEKANKYLIKFSRLLRKILESNLSGQIALESEVNLLEEYIAIECLRFEEEINYNITLDPKLNAAMVQVPVMMVQPFVENAIWHGLLNKAGEKILTIDFKLKDEVYIECTIDDNGTGRKKHEEKKSRKNSMATLFVLQRLELLSKINDLHCTLEIIDKENASGTKVTLLLPILKHK